MRKATHLIIWGIVIILIILLGLPLTGLPFIYSRNTDVDINSGDVRKRTILFTFIVKEEIEQTPFSREVRRLGIPINVNRKWEHASTSALTMHGTARYDSSCRRCITIVAIFNDIDMPDNERTTILQSVLTCLQTGNHEELLEIYLAMLDKMNPVGPVPNGMNRRNVDGTNSTDNGP